MAERGAGGSWDGGRVTVIVLSRNRRDLLMACLAAVARLTYPRIETVVVDNASCDGSAAAVASAFPAVHLLPQPANLGVAGGRNLGLAWSLRRLDPAYLLFLDDDTPVDPAAVTELVAAADPDPKVGLVAPKAYRRPGERTLVSAGGMRFNPWVGAAWDVAAGEEDLGQHDRPEDVQACPGFAFFVRREVADAVGPFDEAFNPYGWEDVDFSLRAARAGYRLVYAPRAVVHHAGGRAGRGPQHDYERHKLRKMLRLTRLHNTPLQLACALLLLLPFRAAYRIGRELARGNVDVVRSWLAGALRSDR
jgi:GT2 family glycosyltransferase